MPGSLADLIVNIVANTKGFDGDIKKSKKAVNDFNKDMQAFGKGMTKYATVPILAVGAAMVKTAIDIEKQKTAFGVLLKDTEKGNQLFTDLQKLASKTPLQLNSITKSAQQLLAAGSGMNELNDTITMLGDIALGDAAKLGTLTNAYSKMQTKGKATMEELNMVTEAGVPILQALADSLGVSVAEVFDLSSKGKIAFEDVKTAMASLTSETGQFNKGMEKLSETTGGKLSTAFDNIKITASEFGVILLPQINDILEATTELFRKFGDLDDGTKKLIIGFAGITAGLGPAISGVYGMSKALKVMASSTGGIGLAIVAVTSLIVLLATLKSERNAELEATFVGITDEVGKSAKEIRVMSNSFKAMRAGGVDLVASQERVAEQYGLTARQLELILGYSTNLSEEDTKHFQRIKLQREEWELLNGSAGRYKKKVEDTVEVITGLTDKQIQGYVDQNDAVQEVINANKTRIEQINEEIAYMNELGLADGELKDNQLAATKILQTEKQSILDEERASRESAYAERKKKEIENNNAVYEIEKETADKIADEAEELKEKRIALGEELISASLAIADAIVQISANQAANEIRIEEEKLDAQLSINAQDLEDAQAIADGKLAIKLSELGELTQAEQDYADFQKELTAIALEDSILNDEAKIAQLLATGTLEDAEEARKLQRDLDNDAALRVLKDTAATDEAQRIVDIQKAKDDAQTAEDKLQADAAAEKLKLEKETAISVWKIEKKQFEAEQNFSLANIAISTAVGIAKTFATLGWPGGILGSAIIVGEGIAQAAVVNSQNAPPKPQLATGAIIQGSQRGVDVTVGESGNDELILGGGSKGDAILSRFADKINSKGGGTVVNNYYQSMFNTTNPSDLRKFNRVNRPYQVAEEQRIGVRK